MMPRDTLYRIAAAPADFRQCHALMREWGETAKLNWPTVLAEREGRLLGFLGTQIQPEAVVAGPLFVAKAVPRPGVVVMRLVEAYENVLRAAGLRVYLFQVQPQNTAWREILTRLAFTPYAKDDTGALWFKREVA